MQVKNTQKSSIQLFTCVFGLIIDLTIVFIAPPPPPPLMHLYLHLTQSFSEYFSFQPVSCKEYLIFFCCLYWVLRHFPLFHIEDMLCICQISRREQFESAKSNVRHCA